MEAMRIKVCLAAVVASLLLASLVQSAPFLVSDNSTEEVDSCRITGLGSIPCTLNANKGIRIDLAGLEPGAYTVTAVFCVQGGLWCSTASAPFSFTKPALNAPARLILSP